MRHDLVPGCRDLCVTAKLTVRDITCSSARSGKGQARGGEPARVVFVRRGAFAAHVGSQHYVHDPCTVRIAWEDTEYRISHPVEGGDEHTMFDLGPELAAEILRNLQPRRDFALCLTPRVQVAYAAFLAVAARSPGDILSCEEAALELLMSAAGTPVPVQAGSGRCRRDIALAAVELLNEDLTANRPISAIADDVGCSPGHLMHAFRAETGATLRGYRQRLRLATALHRIMSGRDDLTRVAADVGFASHAHLTYTFGRLVGVPPRDAREMITRIDASHSSWMRTFVKALVARPA